VSRRVVIVGAGVVGLFCAVRLAQTGARVTLLEAEKEDFSVHGPAASLAAAGMLSPVAYAATDESPLAEERRAIGLASFDLWRRFSAEALWADGVRFDGAALIARDERSAAQLAAAARALGRNVEPLSAAHWRKRTGLDARIDHALFVEDEGTADPPRVLSGLAMEARRFGVAVMFSQDVEFIETDPLRVRTFEGESIAADAVVLAPGPWATRRLIATAPALGLVRPGKGHLAPVTLAQELHINVHAQDFYLARRSAQDVVLGSTMELGRVDRFVDRARIQELLDAAERALPGLVRRPDDEERRPWAGIRPMSPDGAPMIGPSGDALVACGHSRDGWLLAPVTAEIICAHVHGEDIPPLWQAFHPDRFEDRGVGE
jgi:glycine oxidase